MELRFRTKIHHSSLIDADAGHFRCELEDRHLKSGLFHFSGYGEVPLGEVLRLIETTHLSKGVRLRKRQVRFVCVLKRKEVAAESASENGEDADDDPYFCATIDTNGFQILKTLIDTREG